jgi:hypothetical protein
MHVTLLCLLNLNKKSSTPFETLVRRWFMHVFCYAYTKLEQLTLREKPWFVTGTNTPKVTGNATVTVIGLQMIG